MSQAPYFNRPGMTEPALLGQFCSYHGAAVFEYSERPAEDRGGIWPEYPHRIFTCDGDRAARVGKTVAYVVIDETPNGAPIVEKWKLRCFRAYPAPAGRAA